MLRDHWQSNCGVNQYDYPNAFEKINEEQLPSKQQFCSRLSEEDLTNDDCNKAKQIRKHFNIKNMGVYHDLYLQTGVLLLTDVLEQTFGDMCSNYYGLDPVYDYALPNFAFGAMLELRPSILLYPT